MFSDRISSSSRRAITAALLAITIGSVASAQGGPGFLTLDISSDTLDSAPGVELFTVDSHGFHFATTDQNGVTGEIAYEPNEVTLAVLAETQTPQGILLGQVIALPWDPFNSTLRIHEYFQPVAIPFTLSSNMTTFGADPYHQRWSISNVVASPYTFNVSAHVGILLNPEDVSGFEYFNQVTFPTTQNEVGVVIRLPEGDPPTFVDFILRVDYRGHESADQAMAPTVTGVVLVDDPTAVTQQPFDAFLFRYEDGHAYVRVTGYVFDGDNTILLGSSPSPADGTVVLGRVPIYTGPPTGPGTGGGGEPEGGGTDCIPTPPSPPGEWTCAVVGNPPVSSPQCVAAKKVAEGCGTETKKVHGPKCGGAGDTMSEQTTESGGGSVSINLGPAGSATGSYSYASGSTTAHNFTNSNPNQPNASTPGCGTCVSWFMHGLVCHEVWEYERYEMQYENDPWSKWPLPVGYECVKYKKTLKCTDSSGPSASQPCNRTNCN